MAAKIKFVNKDKTQFFSVLKQRVDNYFVENHVSQYADSRMIIKTVFMVSLYFIPYSLVLTGIATGAAFWICWATIGLGLAGIGMSVMHDANHGAYSANPKINRNIALILNIVGGDCNNWIVQHNILHHTYTNIQHHDEDIDDKVGMRFSPNGKFRPAQRFQVIYVFAFYTIMTLYWTTVKDFLQHFRYIREGHNRAGREAQRKRLLQLIAWKVFYISYIIVLPALFTPFSIWQILLGFLLLHAVAGLVLSIVFQLAHVVENTTFPIPDEKGNIDNDWAIHQLETTADFAKNNPVITFFVGGLNYQAIHHLFPRICHVHYPEIAPIVEQTAKEFGVKYIYNKSFWSALASHVRVLNKLGRNETTFVAIAEHMG